MKTQLSTKFAALAVAIIMNAGLCGSVAYLFSGSISQASAVSLVATESSSSVSYG